MNVRNIVKSIQNIMRKDAGVDGDAQRLGQLCWMFFLKIIDDQDRQLAMSRSNYVSPIPQNLQWHSWASNPQGIRDDELINFIEKELFPKLRSLPVTDNKGERQDIVQEVFSDASNYMKSAQLMRQVINKINGINFNNLTERQHFGDVYEQLLNDLQGAKHSGEFYTPRGVTAFMVERVDPKLGEVVLDPACGTGGFLTCTIRYEREKYVQTLEDEQLLQKSLRAVEKKKLPHMLCITNLLLHGIENPSFVRHGNTLLRSYESYGASDEVDIILTNPPFGGEEEEGVEVNFPKSFQSRETADLFVALIVRLLKHGGRSAIVLPDGFLSGKGVQARLREHLLTECNLHTIVKLPNSVFKPYASVGTNLLFFTKGEPTEDIWYYEHRVPDVQKAYSLTKPIRADHLQACVDWWGGVEREGREESEVTWKVGIDEIKARSYNLDIKNPYKAPANFGNPEELLSELDAAEQKVFALRDNLKSILEDALLR